jgi:hypothetical protein
MNSLNPSSPRRGEGHLKFHAFNGEQAVALGHLRTHLRVDCHHGTWHLGSHFGMRRARTRISRFDPGAPKMPVSTGKLQVHIITCNPAPSLQGLAFESDPDPAGLTRIDLAKAYAPPANLKGLIGLPLEDVDLLSSALRIIEHNLQTRLLSPPGLPHDPAHRAIRCRSVTPVPDQSGSRWRVVHHDANIPTT